VFLIAWSAIARPTPPTSGPGAPLPEEFRRTSIPPALLAPLPTTGGVPRMVPARVRPGTAEDWATHDRRYALLRMQQLRAGSAPATRASGLAAIRECKDPSAFESMYGALKGERHDVQMAMLDAFAVGGDEGQYAIASMAIQSADKGVRAEATRRLTLPPGPGVLAAIDDGLRAGDHEWVNNAGVLAGAVHAIEAIPQLIFAQYVQQPTEERGDRAWIAIGKTTSYVQNVVPVTGDNSGAFQPVIGQVYEGVVFRIQDCVATVYHGGVHDSLVAMTTYDSGMDTAGIGWDMRAWRTWFDTTYVAIKRRQADELAAAVTPSTPAR